MRSLRLLPFCFSGMMLCLPAFAQGPPQDPLENLAVSLVWYIQRVARTDLGKNKVAVLEFVNRDETPTELSTFLADRVQEALLRHKGDLVFVERRNVAEVMRNNGLTYALLRGDEVKNWIGRLLQVRYVISGEYSRNGNELCLTARMWRVGDEKEIGGGSAKLVWTNQLAGLRDLLLDKDGPFSESGMVAGENGITFPKCIYCPRPEYSPRAYEAKLQGTVLIWALVGEDGTTKNVILRRSLEIGLNEVSMATVRKWRFEPPRDARGKPIAAWATMEITFRLH